ncbi:hypothetical protein HPB50_023426 [Hyalomma asiaticum]|uniref:Uncharacterized protein n=1 Tax=Hyalomma asiaticum TaxID=266040 RepID=A0ACB7TQ72_HYAAI|nr:hypothetical protein HPB50_023426 [Hyalomma asiaticum]
MKYPRNPRKFCPPCKNCAGIVPLQPQLMRNNPNRILLFYNFGQSDVKHKCRDLKELGMLNRKLDLSVGSCCLQTVLLLVLVAPRMNCEQFSLGVSIGLKAKYQGCMVGALIGDCLGSPFEHLPYRHVLSTSQLHYFLWRIRRKSVKEDDNAGRRFTADSDHDFGGYYKYTDDTAMTHALAEALLDCGGFEPAVVARRQGSLSYIVFTEGFFGNKDVKGEYGPKVRNVFAALVKARYEDIWAPAKEQFNGTGSYGNGAAMRVAPVALYYYEDETKAVQVAQEQSKLTHANPLGYNGAALICLAVQFALSLDPSKKLDVEGFLDTLKLRMEKIETEGGR